LFGGLDVGAGVLLQVLDEVIADYGNPTLIGYRSLIANGDFGLPAIIYSQDFSTDPGWITSIANQFFWDQSSGRYYAEIRPGGGQYAYVKIQQLSTNVSFKLQFDLTMVRQDYASGFSFGLSGPAFSFSTAGTTAIWANYGRGGGGSGATVGYKSDTIPFGFFPGPYDFLTGLNTTYHNEITYNSQSQMLHWSVTAGGLLLGDFSSISEVGTFTGIDRILVENVNSAGTSAGYLDNVVVSLLP
jgi:hypothetical protein